MSASNVPAFVPFKKSDYGDDGLGSKDALDKFFVQMNTQNQALIGALGGGLDFQNLNGQAFEFDLQTPSSDWLDMTLGTGFTAFNPTHNPSTWSWPQYRVDGAGRLYLRGLLASLSAPGSGTTVWAYPNSKYAPTGVSVNTVAGCLFACPEYVLARSGTSGGRMYRMDAYSDRFAYLNQYFAGTAQFGWTGIPLAANFVSAGTAPAYTMDGSTGRVYLRGNVGNSLANVTSGQIMGTLPAGFRPLIQMDYSGIFDGVTNPLQAGFLRVETSGDIKIFFAVAAQKMNSCPLAQVSFDTVPNPDFGQEQIQYMSLDAVSWQTIGAAPTMSCFPVSVRVQDGKVVKDVFLTSVLDSQQDANTPAGPPSTCSWVPNQAKTGFPNSFSISSIPGIALGRKYHVRGVALFQ